MCKVGFVIRVSIVAHLSILSHCRVAFGDIRVSDKLDSSFSHALAAIVLPTVSFQLGDIHWMETDSSRFNNPKVSLLCESTE
jgi:hypothetical protein